MSDFVPKEGSLDVSKTVHDFMSTIEHNPKKGEYDQLKLFDVNQKNEIFKNVRDQFCRIWDIEINILGPILITICRKS